MKNSMHLLVTVAFATLALLFSTYEARADLYDDYINSSSKRPFVAFLARTSDGSFGKPGHSFVAIGVELDNGEKVYERIFGYYPISEDAFTEVKGTFSSTSGDLTEKLKDIVWQVEYIVSIDETKHQAALNVASRWQKDDPQYNLFADGGKNCNAFVAEVADAIGLKVPGGAGSTFPMAFIATLKKVNGGSN